MTTSFDKPGGEKKPPEVSHNECEIVPFPKMDKVFKIFEGVTSFSIEKDDEEKE